MTNRLTYTAIPNQFSSFIREEYPRFVEFLQAYYKFLDQETKTGGIEGVKDIDLASQEYIQYYRKEFAIDIPEFDFLESRRFILFSRALYEAKGTEDALRFLHRAAFDKEIDISYPKDQILRASSGRWFKEYFIEISVGAGDWSPYGPIGYESPDGSPLFISPKRATVLPSGRVRFYFDIPPPAVFTGTRFRQRDPAGEVTFLGITEEAPVSVEILDGGSGWKPGQLVRFPGNTSVDTTPNPSPSSEAGVDTFGRVLTTTPSGEITSVEVIEYGQDHTFEQELVASSWSYVPSGPIHPTTWAVRSTTVDQSWVSVASNEDGTRLVAAAFNGFIYTSENFGATWIEKTSGGSRQWDSVACSADGMSIVAVCYPGSIYTSVDRGVTWIERTSAGSRDWSSVACSANGMNIVATVDYGYVYTSTDAGATWTERQVGAAEINWTSVACSSNGMRIALAPMGGFVHTSVDGGVTWMQIESLGDRNWSSIASSADGASLIVVPTQGRARTSNDYGVTWTIRDAPGITPPVVNWTQGGEGSFPYITPEPLGSGFIMHPGPNLERPVIRFDNTFSSGVFSVAVTCTDDGQVDTNWIDVIKNGVLVDSVAQGIPETLSITLALNDYLEFTLAGPQFGSGGDILTLVITKDAMTWDAHADFVTAEGWQVAPWSYFYREDVGYPAGTRHEMVPVTGEPSAPSLMWGVVASSGDGMKLAWSVASTPANTVSGEVFTSFDGGETWGIQTIPRASSFQAMTASSDGAYLIGSDTGKIWVGPFTSNAPYETPVVPPAPAPTYPIWEATPAITTPADSSSSLAYGADYYVSTLSSSAAGYDGVIRSQDGINWTTVPITGPIGFSKSWKDIVYAAGKFVMVLRGDDVIKTSETGLTWTDHVAPNATIRTLHYLNNTFILIAGASMGASVADVYTSADAITWSAGTTLSVGSIVNYDNVSMTYGNGIYLASEQNDYTYATSTDGLTWTARTFPTPSNAAAIGFEKVVFGAGKFVSVNSYDNTIIYSTDGLTWTEVTNPAGDTFSWDEITYNPLGGFLAVGYDGTGTKSITSEDGITWTATTMPGTQPASSVVGGPDKFVVLFYNNGSPTFEAAIAPYPVPDVAPPMAIHTLLGDLTNSTFPSIDDTYVAGNYVRSYVAGFFKNGTDLTVPSAIPNSSIMFGVVFEGTLSGGTAKLVVNGTVIDTYTEVTSPKGVVLYAETSYEGVREWLGPNRGFVDSVYFDINGVTVIELIGAWPGDVTPVYTFDTQDIKYGWYVDQCTGSGDGVLVADHPIYVNPPMMYVLRPTTGTDYSAVTWDDLPIDTSPTAHLYYDRDDSANVGLNVNIGGYAQSWTDPTPPGVSGMGIWYDLSYPTTVPAPGGFTIIDGAIRSEPPSTSIDMWSYQGWFEVWTPAGLANYTVAEQAQDSPITPGQRYYPGISSSSAYGQFVQALNYGQPVLYEMWYSSPGPAPAPAPRATFTWTARTTSDSTTWVDVASSANGSTIYALAQSGPMQRSSDAGATWSYLPGSFGSGISVTSSADGRKVAVAKQYSEYIYTSIDRGTTWVQRTGSTARDWSSVAWSADGSTLVAVSSGGSYVTKSTDNGATWTPITFTPTQAWTDVSLSADGSKIALVANGASIQTSTDSGATWTEQAGSIAGNWVAVDVSAAGDVMVAADNGGLVYVSNDSGVTWEVQSDLPSTNWSSVSISGDGNTIAAVDNGGLVYTNVNKAPSWVPYTSAGTQSWNAVDLSYSGLSMAAVEYGGNAWTASGAYPAPTPTKTLTAYIAAGFAVHRINPDTGTILESSASTEPSWDNGDWPVHNPAYGMVYSKQEDRLFVLSYFNTDESYVLVFNPHTLVQETAIPVDVDNYPSLYTIKIDDVGENILVGTDWMVYKISASARAVTGQAIPPTITYPGALGICSTDMSQVDIFPDGLEFVMTTRTSYNESLTPPDLPPDPLHYYSHCVFFDTATMLETRRGQIGGSYELPSPMTPGQYMSNDSLSMTTTADNTRVFVSVNNEGGKIVSRATGLVVDTYTPAGMYPYDIAMAGYPYKNVFAATWANNTDALGIEYKETTGDFVKSYVLGGIINQDDMLVTTSSEGTAYFTNRGSGGHYITAIRNNEVLFKYNLPNYQNYSPASNVVLIEEVIVPPAPPTPPPTTTPDPALEAEYAAWVASRARVRLKYGTIGSNKGYWLTEDGHISNEAYRLQDDFFYQAFSYLITSTVNSPISNTIIEINHPIGFKYFKQYDLQAKIQYSLSGSREMSKDTVYLIDTVPALLDTLNIVLVKPFEDVLDGMGETVSLSTTKGTFSDTFSVEDATTSTVETTTYAVDGYVTVGYVTINTILTLS